MDLETLVWILDKARSNPTYRPNKWTANFIEDMKRKAVFCQKYGVEPTITTKQAEQLERIRDECVL